MSEILTQSVTVAPYAHEAHSDRNAQSDIKKSVFHTVLAPIGLGIASPLAGIAYFLFAVAAYLTIFRDKNHYVLLILKTAGAIIAALAGWILLMGFVGAIGAVS